jgi:trk system potassium uptake protein TrkA
VGLGRFGSALALELTRNGTEVLAVDADLDLVQRHAGLLERVVAADATDIQSLQELGAQEFERAVVAIGSHQEASILATSLLSELGIPHVWAKALSAQHARILSRVGAHHVVLPEHEMGERIAHLVSGRLLDYMEVEPGWVMAKAKPPRDIVGIPLGESKLRTNSRVTVVGVKTGADATFRHADSSTFLTYNDDILVMGRPEDVEAFVEG